jgi:hypothetical protein
MAFFYSKGGTTNVIASLTELEEAVGILTGALVSRRLAGTAAGADFRLFAHQVAATVASGGKIHVIVDGVGRTPLSSAPPPMRARVTTALSFYSRLAGAIMNPENVELID